VIDDGLHRGSGIFFEADVLSVLELPELLFFV
jgi:hypothetical protein